MSTSYDVNYDDQRFKSVESEKSAALSEHEKLYDDMISNSDNYYQKQIDASKDWAKTQTQLQNDQTDFAIKKIEQEKEQAKKDYTREQSGAYADWQKQSDRYGARAEQLADRGMQNTGYSESSQVSMYNTYQNRVATARESYTRAVQDFNNGITEARLQNNSALAEIRYKALQQQLELSLQGFQTKNQLLLDKANQKLTIENNYYNRYQDVLKQINTENALAEEIRQFNAQMAEDKRQFNRIYGKKSSGSSGGSSRSSSSTGGNPGLYDPKKPDDKPEEEETSGGLPLNLKSVIKAGYAGRSGETIAKAVKSGKLGTTVKNGQVVVTKKNPVSIHNPGLTAPWVKSLK